MSSVERSEAMKVGLDDSFMSDLKLKIMSTETHFKKEDFQEGIIAEGECEEVPEVTSPCRSFERSSKGSSVSQKKTQQELLSSIEWDGLSLYDHLKNLIELIVATRPGNTIDYFDQYSRSIRDPKGSLRPEERWSFALKVMRMVNQVLLGQDLSKKENGGEEDGEEEGIFGHEKKYLKKVACTADIADYLIDIEIAIPKHEFFLIDIALTKLSQIDGIREVRFWGKIFGIEKSYIVAECVLFSDEIQRRFNLEYARFNEEGEEEELESVVDQPPVFGFGSVFKHDPEEEEIVYKKLYEYKMPPLPIPVKKSKIKMMPERIGQGANKYIYYVCHDPGDEWIPLPNVTPEQIIAARKIRKYMQGYLEAEVDCYPPFPGKEINFLRAQIARITAGTHISPLGYYQFGNSDEMDEGVDMEEIVRNEHFDAIPYLDLLDKGFWVHHKAHILRIGRTTYWEPPIQDEMDEEREKPEEKEEKTSNEISPPILTPISEDVTLEGVDPWKIKGTSKLIPGPGVVAVRSNLWPGAYAFCKGRSWENVYLGDGIKLSNFGFTPQRPPRHLSEYPTDPEITEAVDPTPEQEAEWKAAHLPPKLPDYHEEGEGEEGPIYPDPDDELNPPD